MISTLLIWLASALHPGHCHDCPPPEPPPLTCEQRAAVVCALGVRAERISVQECKDRIKKECKGIRSSAHRRN